MMILVTGGTGYIGSHTVVELMMARRDAGRQLDRVQRGKQANDFKPMPSIGKGVEEIRVWDDAG